LFSNQYFDKLNRLNHNS